jgi:hypothetical protein
VGERATIEASFDSLLDNDQQDFVGAAKFTIAF